MAGREMVDSATDLEFLGVGEEVKGQGTEALKDSEEWIYGGGKSFSLYREENKSRVDRTTEIKGECQRIGALKKTNE